MALCGLSACNKSIILLCSAVQIEALTTEDTFTFWIYSSNGNRKAFKVLSEIEKFYKEKSTDPSEVHPTIRS